jgi:hypothetical protein
MPVHRKPNGPNTILTPRPLAEAIRDGLPRRIVVYVVVRDESGSMSRWRQRQGEFIPAVAAHLLEAGGPRVGELIYILYVVVSGGVVATEFVPLSRAADPPFVPDGQTPIGKALGTVAEKVVDFFESRVFPEEVTPRNLEILIVSDLRPTGETKDETETGVEQFLAMAKKYRAKVNLVGPSPEAMNEELAGRLDVSGRGVKYLDSDPKSIIAITFDSLLSASRTSLGGSNPSVRMP